MDCSNLIFVDTKVKSNLHINMTAAKTVSVRHRLSCMASSSSLSRTVQG